MTASAWTDDRVGRLKTLWLKGRTAEQIARELANGITRNAVLSKVYRMGLSAGRPARPAKASWQSSSAAGRRLRSPTARVSVGEATPPSEIGCATLLSVGRHDCRWPLGDACVADFSLCGRRAVRGAYCEAHAKIAYRSARTAPQDLERLAQLL